MGAVASLFLITGKQGGVVDQLENLVELLPKEISKSLSAMSATNDLDKKKIHSEIVLNLCKSMGVFIDAMDIMGLDDDMCFDEPPLELHESRKTAGRKRKKNNKDDLPF